MKNKLHVNVGKVLLTPNSSTYNFLVKRVVEAAATIIYTDASKWPGHKIQVWQAEARSIGEEIQAKDFADTRYSELDMPPAPAARGEQQTQPEISPQK